MKNASVRGRRLAAGSLLGLSALVAGGCVYARVDRVAVAPDGYEVTDSGMRGLVESNNAVGLGQPRDAVLSAYPPGALSLKSSATIDGYRVEEWRAQAVSHDRDTFFRRYLYFVDGALAELSDDRVEYREEPGVVARWTGH